jgi:hypothetical protein
MAAWSWIGWQAVDMLASRLRSRAAATPAMSAGAISGSSPWTLTTMSVPARPSAAAASATRSVPDTWFSRVMSARCPACSTALRIRSSSVATATAAAPLASARSQTCTIIGLPASSASGLPGKRLDA